MAKINDESVAKSSKILGRHTINPANRNWCNKLWDSPDIDTQCNQHNIPWTLMHSNSTG